MNPYLGFSGSTANAMNFYHSVFGGDLNMMTFAEAGAGDFAANPDHIMHAQLTTPEGWVLMAADSEERPGEGKSEPRVTVALVGSIDKLAEFEAKFSALADGGKVTVPMENQMWGAVYGQVTDKIGVSWHFNIGS